MVGAGEPFGLLQARLELQNIPSHKVAMSPSEIQRGREKLRMNPQIFAEVFGLSSPSVVRDIENGSVKPANIIITMLTLLDGLPDAEAIRLLDQMISAAKNSR